MALFSNLLSRIWGQAETATPPAASTEGAPTATPTADTPAPPLPRLLPSMWARAERPGRYAGRAAGLATISIVDLLKLVGLDNGLAARKELATDLGYTGALDGSAAMDLWLHKAVMKKLADNGGKVPQELLD